MTNESEITDEEMILVLENFRMLASPYEKRVLDKIRERIEEEDA